MLNEEKSRPLFAYTEEEGLLLRQGESWVPIAPSCGQITALFKTLPHSAYPRKTLRKKGFVPKQTSKQLGTPYRAWVNQPCSHQPMHHLHGKNVLACRHEVGALTTRVFFLSGDTVSMEVPSNALSLGWKDDQPAT